MSTWTCVKIIYEVRKGYIHKRGITISDRREYSCVDIRSLFDSFMNRSCKRSILEDLGLEDGCDIQLKSYEGTSGWVPAMKHSIGFHDRGFLFITGHLRGVERKEFISELNKFTKALQDYNIFIDDAVVKIN